LLSGQKINGSFFNISDNPDYDTYDRQYVKAKKDCPPIFYTVVSEAIEHYSYTIGEKDESHKKGSSFL